MIIVWDDDEVKLTRGVHYGNSNQIIIGYEDLGDIGQSLRQADHALVLMARGARKRYKQPIAYYFTKGTVSSEHLKQIIVTAVPQLENMGLHILATVCDQGPTNVGATNQLCNETVNDTPSGTFFVVDEEFVVNSV